MESKIGASFICEHSFSQSDFDRFADLSGDDNPIHVDPQFSSRTKFGRTVAHGMLLYASISSCLSTYFPDFYQISQELIFPNPTYAGEPIRIHLTIAGDSSEQGILTVESIITRRMVRSPARQTLALPTCLISLDRMMERRRSPRLRHRYGKDSAWDRKR
jgi:acyl dehydratase